MEAALARKPLTALERTAAPATVCVTGGAGYIASAIVVRLLAAGHTVHATYRKGDDKASLAALHALPGASERLRWFQADLLQPGSFDAAVAGCKYVIHTAGPVLLNTPASKAFARCITPTVKGVQNVLDAANKAGSVERVVLTSSIAASCGGEGRHPEGPAHVFTEEDWNTDLSPDFAYEMAKTLGEWEAWAIAAQQSRWSLVTVNPALVMGPPLAANSSSESVKSWVKLMDGSTWPLVPPMGMPVVDIADVAAAHTLAMLSPHASGRYLLCERTTYVTDIAAILRHAFPGYWIPSVRAPYWFMVGLALFTGFINIKYLRAAYERRILLSSDKALRELVGLGPLIPLERTLKDMGTALIDLGLVPQKAAPAAAGGKVAQD